jgi:hypothetical protein
MRVLLGVLCRLELPVGPLECGPEGSHGLLCELQLALL